jgi:hypothetical protein
MRHTNGGIIAGSGRASIGNKVKKAREKRQIFLDGRAAETNNTDLPWKSG